MNDSTTTATTTTTAAATPTSSGPLPDGASAPAAPSAAPASPPKLVKASRRTLVLMAGVALVGVALVLWAWRLGPFATSVVHTDDAYVRGQVTVLAPQVSGYVAEVAVKDFANVKAGDVLLRIDDRIYAGKVQQAQAQLEAARAQLANAEQAQAQNRANLQARQATQAAARAEATRAAADLQRVEELVQRGSVSQRERDQARATAQLAQANVQKSQADIAIGHEQIKATQVSRAGLQAQVSAAEAQLQLAQIDLANTVVRAPRDGQVGEASARPGQYVTAGSQLFFLVPDQLWVVANFKETQMAHVQPGQRARFAVDALEGQVLTGHVERIAPATGSEFSVLRADNASGNFTKVVQRLPVRIAIDPGQSAAARLRPGMSVIAHVDTATDAAPTPHAALATGVAGARP
ncbi:HlyD family secretion protein [Xenophilus arseniciresistens]|uniref:HlyD family secretion protein n=1 Tax=Xenophilus arseniciresistens TaxID=1283306 RepID=A0AAE3T157_9BURK|nr:HlyD family secretion protein [Xenophilus arseniciresistens]MDA7417651.1 HlyD family secretion protein [Xenophilus arseniciresistens]